MVITKWNKMFYLFPTIYWLRSDKEIGITWLSWSVGYTWSK